MATILLTEEEYNHFKTMKQDLLAKAQNASPRAATVYQIGARLFGDFIAREDGKRATASEKANTRNDLQALRNARRNSRIQPQATPPNPAPSTGRTGAASRAS